MSSICPDSRDAMVLVWGATGFIGRNLIHYLQPRVKRVIAIRRTNLPIEGIENCTLQESESWKLEGRVIAINLAAERYDAGQFQHYQSHIFARNVEIATRFYDFCLHRDIKEARVASSIAVYGGNETLLDDSLPINQNELPAASEAMYGASKRISEDIAALYHAKYGINSILFRLSNPYGPHDSIHADRAHVLAAFVIRALTTSGPFTVRGNKDATRDFIFVRDVCEILYRSLGMQKHAAYNLATGQNTRITDLATLVLKATGASRPVVFEGESTSSVVHRICKVDRLKRDFAMETFTPLEAGLAETIAWYRTQAK